MIVASLVKGLYLTLSDSIWLYLKNELIEWTDFLHAGANSGKLKVITQIFGWAWPKMEMAIYFMRPYNLLI